MRDLRSSAEAHHISGPASFLLMFASWPLRLKGSGYHRPINISRPDGRESASASKREASQKMTSDRGGTGRKTRTGGLGWTCLQRKSPSTFTQGDVMRSLSSGNERREVRGKGGSERTHNRIKFLLQGFTGEAQARDEVLRAAWPQ